MAGRECVRLALWAAAGLALPLGLALWVYEVPLAWAGLKAALYSILALYVALALALGFFHGVITKPQRAAVRACSSALFPKWLTLANLFRLYVRRVAARHPLLLILGSFALPALAASYLLWGTALRIDTDPNLIWVPPGSTTFRQKALFDAAFDPFFRVSQVIVTQTADAALPAAAAPYGALQPEYLAALLALQTALFSGATAGNVTLTNVCFRLEKEGPCLVETPLNFFQSDPAIVDVLDAGYIQEFVACQIPDDFCERVPSSCDPVEPPLVNRTQASFRACIKDGVPVIKEVVLGGRAELPNGPLVSVCGQRPVRADALVLTLLLDSTPQKAVDAAAWEKEVFLPLVSAFKYPGLSASYMAERSISDALEIVDEQNQYVVIVSYGAMFVYIVLALGKFPHPLAMRSGLGLQGIVIVLLSVLASLGLWTMGGGHITMIVNEVVPFLILAIGVDNMFILSRAFDRRWWGPLGSRARALRGDAAPPFVRPRAGSQSAESSVTCGVDAETALCEALAEVGPTISAAAVCEVVAFAVGVTMNIPALTQFCGVAAIAVAIDFWLQMTWFVPAVLLDSRRQELRCLDMAPCITLRGPGEPHTRCNPCCARRAQPEGERGEVVDALGYGASGMGMDVGLDRGYARFGPWQDAARAAMETTLKEARARELAGGGGCCGASGASKEEGEGMAESLLGGVGDNGYDASDSIRAAMSSGAMQFAAVGPGSLQAGGGASGSASSSIGAAAQLRLAPVPNFLTQLPPFGSSPRLMDDSPDPDTDTLLEAYGVGGDEPGGPPPAPTTPKFRGSVAEGAQFAGSSGEAPGALELTRSPARGAPPSPGSAPASPARAPGGGGRSMRPLPLKPTGCLCLSPYFWGIANRGNFVRRAMSHFYIPCLLHPGTRAAVLLAWLGLLAMGGLALSGLRLGLEQQLILPTGSYLAQYFDDQSRHGDAGPPAYLVLQNVNYSHPAAFSRISDLGIAMSSLDVLVPPVYSWVSDFQLWTEAPGFPNVTDCPEVPEASPATLAEAVAFFIYKLPVTGRCCQAQGYCGGQYATDVQFLWGVPKAGSSSSLRDDDSSSFEDGSSSWSTAEASYVSADGVVRSGAPGPVTRVGWETRVGEPVSGRSRDVVASRTRVTRAGEAASTLVDDGGCNLTAGYVSQAAVKTALALAYGPGALLSHQLRLPHAAAARAGGFPPAMLEALRDPANQLKPCHIMISRLRAQHRPLRNQSDYIRAKAVMQTAMSSLQGRLPEVDFELLGLGAAPSSDAAPQPGVPGPYTNNTHTSWLPAAPGGAAFPYSLIYVYYEQYGYIRGVALTNLSVAVLAVFAACLIVSSLAVALAVLVMVSSLTLCVCGWTWALNPHGTPDPYGAGPYGVDVNAVFVVNLITATGLGVEFMIHITAAYLENIRTERERQRAKRGAAEAAGAAAAARAEEAAAAGSLAARAALWWSRVQWLSHKERTTQVHGALVEMGSSVVTGITFTKLVGVLILAKAPSMLFRLYYFRIYLGIIVMGAFHGLALVPVLLATFGLPDV